MASLDWSNCSAVESVPGRVSGAWVFRDTRLPVATVLENLEDLTMDEVIEQFDVEREQIQAVLRFVAQSLAAPVQAEAFTTVDASSFDQGTPRGLIRELAGHAVTTAKARGWETLSNGELLQAAEDAGFEVFLTTDQRIRYQQNLAGRKIALVVLTGTTKWSQVRLNTARIDTAVSSAQVGAYAEVFIPFKSRAG